MRQPIQMLTMSVCGLLLVGGVCLRADEPATEGGVVATMTGSTVFEDTGYVRISHHDWTPPTSTYLSRSPLVYSRMYPGSSTASMARQQRVRSVVTRSSRRRRTPASWVSTTATFPNGSPVPA